MSLLQLKDLDPRLQKQVDGASKAVERGDARYAIDVCRNILERNPGCLDVRKILRRAQYKAVGGQKGAMSKIFTKFTQGPFSAAKQVEKDAKAALQQAEDMLTKNPYNPHGHRLLGAAALAEGIPDTAAFAYEEIKRLEPKNIPNLIELGKALLEAKRPKESVKVGEGILATDPGNGPASELMKHASVMISEMKGWASQDGKEVSYKDLIADKDESIELERANAAFQDEESLKLLIERAKKKLEATPDDINLYRDVSNHYAKLKDFDQAIAWIKKAREQPKGQTDSTLERTEGDLHASKMEAGIAAKKEELEAKPDDAALKEEIARVEKELGDFRHNEKKNFVEKYPNDYFAHFEFGELLFEAGNVEASIKEFQLAQRNRQVRLKALLYLGKAFKSTRKFDLAAERLEEVKKDSAIMDYFKKEVIYELADCYEQMGRKDDAVREYKIIYSADIGYRDVQEKIDSFYEGN